MKFIATILLIPIVMISVMVAIPIIIWRYANELIEDFENWYDAEEQEEK